MTSFAVQSPCSIFVLQQRPRCTYNVFWSLLQSGTVTRSSFASINWSSSQTDAPVLSLATHRAIWLPDSILSVLCAHITNAWEMYTTAFIRAGPGAAGWTGLVMYSISWVSRFRTDTVKVFTYSFVLNQKLVKWWAIIRDNCLQFRKLRGKAYELKHLVVFS